MGVKMRKKILSNIPFILGLISWILLIIDIITFGFLFPPGKFSRLMILSWLHYILTILFIFSVFLPVTGLVLGMVDYFSRRLTVKIFLIILIFNLSYIVVYLFIMYIFFGSVTV